MPEPDDMLSVKQIVARLGIDKATWWRWRKFGDAPVGILIGPNTLRFRWSEVETWLQARQEKAS